MMSKRDEICPHCKMSKEIRNPSGFCDHLYYPEYCDVCSGKNKNNHKRDEIVEIIKNSPLVIETIGGVEIEVDKLADRILEFIETNYVTHEWHEKHLQENKDYYENRDSEMTSEIRKRASVDEILKIIRDKAHWEMDDVPYIHVDGKQDKSLAQAISKHIQEGLE